MYLLHRIFALLPLYGALADLSADQKPLRDAVLATPSEVREELQRSEIIPTVIDDFMPRFSLDVDWSRKDYADLGNTLQMRYVQPQPRIRMYEENDEDVSITQNTNYVITLTDPDSPSRDNPVDSEMCHWIATGVRLSERNPINILPFPSFEAEEGGGRRERKKGDRLEDILSYKPPSPPPNTGKHRYVFLVFAPRNRTTERLNLRRPRERRFWGYGQQGMGVSDWAREHELEPIAANFVYTENNDRTEM